MTEVQKLLLHIKSLVWCLSKASQSYNLGLIVASLSERRVLEPLHNTNLGDNLTYIISTLKLPADMRVLIHCLEQLPKSPGNLEIGEVKYEIGHYLQAVEDLDSVPKNSFGVISWLDRHIRGVFYTERHGLVEITVKPDQVRVIYGTLV